MPIVVVTIHHATVVLVAVPRKRPAWRSTRPEQVSPVPPNRKSRGPSQGFEDGALTWENPFPSARAGGVLAGIRSCGRVRARNAYGGRSPVAHAGPHPRDPVWDARAERPAHTHNNTHKTDRNPLPTVIIIYL